VWQKEKCASAMLQFQHKTRYFSGLCPSRKMDKYIDSAPPADFLCLPPAPCIWSMVKNCSWEIPQQTHLPPYKLINWVRTILYAVLRYSFRQLLQNPNLRPGKSERIGNSQISFKIPHLLHIFVSAVHSVCAISRLGVHQRFLMSIRACNSL